MDAGTIIAIAVPNIVTALALWLTWKSGERRIAHGRELADLDAVRDLFDAAAVDLREVMIAIHPATGTVFDTSDHQMEPERAKEAEGKLGEHGESLDIMVERFRVRFGSKHIVVVSLEDTIGAPYEARRALWELDEGEIDREDAKQRVRDEIQHAQMASETFLTAAHQVAGARLPDVTTPS